MTKDKLYRRRLKRKAKKLLGNCCSECGRTNKLEFHHEKGGGDEHRAQIGRSSDNIHRHVVRGNGDPKVVLLCHLCHRLAHCPQGGVQ